MSLNIEQIYHRVRNFEFQTLFVKELRWSPPVNTLPTSIDAKHTRLEIARLSGIPVFEINASDGKIPTGRTRAALYDELTLLFPSSLLIFLNKERTQSLWYWIKREYDLFYKRDYTYTKGQPEDLFLTALYGIRTDLLNSQEKDQRRYKSSDLHPLSQRIVDAFDSQRLDFSGQISGIEHKRDRDLYAMILLNRLLFLYFLQRRGFLDHGHTAYLESHLEALGDKNYYRQFLLPLFAHLSQSITVRNLDEAKRFGSVPYLGGGKFLSHALERDYPAIQIPNSAFSRVFSFFARYEWRIVDVPTVKEDEISPDTLGGIFEMYFNRLSQNAAYVTPPEIIEYFCRQTIHRRIVEKVNRHAQKIGKQGFTSLQEVFDKLDAPLCSILLEKILPALSILDPACGSGTYLVAALNTLVLIYSELITKAKEVPSAELARWLSNLREHHPNRLYVLKKRIITINLFGVDIAEEATEITRLRLYLALIASLDNVEDLEPLPDIDFNLYTGNSLIGFLHMENVEPTQPSLFLSDFQASLQEHNSFVTRYRETSSSGDDLQILREAIVQRRPTAIASLNNLLLEEFHQLQRNKRRRVTPSLRNRSGESVDTMPNPADIEGLQPFHWGYDFDQVMDQGGGFDVIMTSPPWKPVKSETSPIGFYQHLYYESAPQYRHQHSNSGAQRASLNLYKLFLEQCYNLLGDHGNCSMIVPAGLCTEQSATGLRQLLFEETQITGLFCFENRREILRDIDFRFEFALLSFEKGKKTITFPAAFSRQELEDLAHFPTQYALSLSLHFLRRFSPGVLAIGKFKTQKDISICEKMQRFPMLGEACANDWNLKLNAGILTSPHSRLDLTHHADEGLPLYEGKTIQQFTHTFAPLRFWISSEFLQQEEQRRFSNVAQALKQGKPSDAHGYHLVFRSITSSTNDRSMIATILPPGTLISNTLLFITSHLEAVELLFLAALFNSFVVDFALRLRISNHISIATVQQLPIPRLEKDDKYFSSLVNRAAQLICVTEDFKNLWEEATRSPWSSKKVAINPVERDQLQAELDGLVANLYNVTEDEFRHILNTFPLVSAPVKVAAQNAYRDVERGLIS